MSELTTWCHVHDGLYERDPGFLSSPLSKQIDGITHPVRACVKCQMIPGAVAEAYKRFTAKESTRRAEDPGAER